MLPDSVSGTRLGMALPAAQNEVQSPKKMCIAVFVSSFPALSETFIVNQLVELKKAGHQVHIYAQRKGAESLIHPAISENKLLEDTVFLDSLPLNRWAKIRLLFCRDFLKKLPLFLMFIWKAPKQKIAVYDFLFYCQKPAYDAVHAHFGINGNYVAKLKRIGLFSGSRFVTSFHGYDLEIGEKKIYRELFQAADVFTTNSDYSMGKLVKLGCPAEKLVKVPVGLDVAYFKKESSVTKTGDCFTILFVGRLVQFKGPDLVVRICDGLRRKGLRFRAWIVGDGEMREELEGMIKAFSLDKEVKLSGPKTQPDIRKMMAEADVFLLPGRTINGRAENQGLVLQEAQAMGLPVVVSDAGGMKEGMIDGVTGFVVEENNIQEFVEVSCELLVNSAKRQKMAKQARLFIEEEFSSKSLNKRWIKFYSKQ